ncbi:MAG: CRP-like cAMP-binding protein [Halioglobus sp.]|jgi:CRP-like cAMP-binding protein
MKIVALDELRGTFTPAYLRELASFGALSQETVEALLTRGRIIALEPREELYHAGAKVQEFFVVLQGKILLYHHHLGKPALTRSFGPGEQIGFAGMIALHDRKGMAVAAQLSYVLEVPADHFFQLHQSAPQDFGLLMLNMAREMARSIGQLGDRIAEMEAHNPSQGDD